MVIPGRDLCSGLHCPECDRVYQRKYRERHARSVRSSYLKRRYGITVAEYEALLKKQGGVCAICLLPERTEGWSLPVDHEHATGRVRGLVCNRCNRGIGLLETADRLRRAAHYLMEERDE